MDRNWFCGWGFSPLSGFAVSIETAPTRPRLLSVLAVLMMLGGGMLALVMGVALLDSTVERTEGLALRTVWMMAVIILLLSSGIGLWKGTYWGWVCAILLVGCNFAWNIVPVIDNLRVAEMPVDQSPDFKNSLIRIGVFAMLLAYLIRNPVMAYCRAERSQWVMALLLACSSCVGFAILLLAM